MPPPSSLNVSSSSCSHTHSATVPSRHIKFAPLPEPTPQFGSDAVMDTPLSSNTVHIQHAPSKPKTSSSRQFNVFKRSSTDLPTDRLQPYDFGAPLSRLACVGTSSISQPRRLPAAPSQSNPRTSSSPHSLDCHTMPQNNILSPSQSTPTRPTVPTNGVRMLNGRVYGSKRQTPTKPFASARDEPEFVEWGYGGMGSVSCSSDSRYSVLAKGAPALLSHSHSNEILVGNARGGAARERNSGVTSLGEGDNDDGSGMSWVRKRRQERTARDRQDM